MYWYFAAMQQKMKLLLNQNPVDINTPVDLLKQVVNLNAGIYLEEESEEYTENKILYWRCRLSRKTF